MRLRVAVSALLLLALTGAVAAAVVSAAPHSNHGLTINATPNPILAGEAVLIYGQLNTKPASDQTIVLYHHIAGTPGYTVVARTTTDPSGFYEFTRAESVVVSNRSWYVRAADAKGAGATGIHSRTVHEHVAALVGLAASAASGETLQPMLFTGNVQPNHAGEEVLLQQQAGSSGSGWKTLTRGLLGAGSNYSIPYRFRIPGDHDVRVRLRGDIRNTAAVSDTTTVAIQQTQNASFTIATSAPVIDAGSSATISGSLYAVGTTTPKPGVSVALLGREAPFTMGNEFVPIGAPVTTEASGNYSFTVNPQRTMEYKVQTSAGTIAHRNTAVLFEGVRHLVTLSPSTTNPTAGGRVTFTGTVTPNAAGHVIELQKLGSDGLYHMVALGYVNAASTYQFAWTVGTPGTKTYRAHIAGGPDNVAGSSPPVSITASLPPVSSLPPAS